MSGTAKRTKRAAAPVRPKMTDEQITKFIVAGIELHEALMVKTNGQ